MRKLASLRDAVLAAPLGVKAKDLLTFAEKGSVRSWRDAGNKAFEILYTAHLIVIGFTGAPQDLFFIVTQWLEANEKDAIPEEAIKFHLDIIDHDSADISLAVEIREIIAARQDDDGLRLVPVPDPDPATFDLASFFPAV